jgi:hypothetical protein
MMEVRDEREMWGGGKGERDRFMESANRSAEGICELKSRDSP